jgi:hypothetical protein
MQFAMGCVDPLLNMPVGQRRNYIADRIRHYERVTLWQQVDSDEFIRIEEDRQH